MLTSRSRKRRGMTEDPTAASCVSSWRIKNNISFAAEEVNYKAVGELTTCSGTFYQ